MVYRVFVEKKEGLRDEARAMKNELVDVLGIKELENVRVVNRYDVENVEKELFEQAKTAVFSEPQVDDVSDELELDCDAAFAVELLPGQFDQRAESAAECIQIISKGERPLVKCAKIYMLYGELTYEQVKQIEKYIINPVEARFASFDTYDTLKASYDIPTSVETIDGFCEKSPLELQEWADQNGLAMDSDDIKFCQNYFLSQERDPTITEIKMIDTYWSDHCRHTTFLTHIDSVSFTDPLLQKTYDEYIKTREELGRTKPVCLMDLATICMKHLKSVGKLDRLDESDEINACTVKIDVDVEGKTEKWLLLFKNETHNHPTEIEPFGGAATCVGGAIRDPLSGRGYVYAAMRITGAADPTKPITSTIKGKLSQRKIAQTAAQGYSSYANQIGVPAGIIDEIYHDNYVAKRMELGAVIAAVPQEYVRRENPSAGDKIILLGGKTGRDGCGGATSSSKSHKEDSSETCGSEVQRGNPPQERKIVRLFRKKAATELIKKCNDFGAGGVSVAIGELADGLEIDLNAVPAKYPGLDGTELAISESQERMAVVVSAADVEKFKALAEFENLEATVVATVTEAPRLVMNWNGATIVDLSREFLNSNGAPKSIEIAPADTADYSKKISGGFAENMTALAGDLNVCSKRGLAERFDSTGGGYSVLMPFGGKNQLTPIQAMVHKICTEQKETKTCSVMAYGYNPFITEKSPYHGAYLAVIESVAKLVAAGAELCDVYLSFQEYFERLGQDKRRWGKPLAALLGAFRAQMDLQIAAIGGKDSMSGTFEDIDVPPTLVSFAVTTEDIENIVSNEFKKSGSKVVLLSPKVGEDGLPDRASLVETFAQVTALMRQGKVLSAYTPTYGGVAEAVMKMGLGNSLGFEFDSGLTLEDIFGYNYGAFILELTEDMDVGRPLGRVTAEQNIVYSGEKLSLEKLLNIYEQRLGDVYPCNVSDGQGAVEKVSFVSKTKPKAPASVAKPRVLIPIFPGTNGEYDAARAFVNAGAEAEIFVANNLSPQNIAQSTAKFAESVKNAQIIFIPGGCSGGDEPDGSGKFITAFFRHDEVRDAVTELLDNKMGLLGGVGNGFQALLKLGLLPYGKIVEMGENSPTLTFNKIGRHQSKLARVRVASNNSPWLANVNVDEVYTVPVSYTEGRFIATESELKTLAQSGQIITQYVDLDGAPTNDVQYNPGGSIMAVEGICSPDGRVLGKMGHSERIGQGLYKNVPGDFDMGLFRAAVEYYN